MKIRYINGYKTLRFGNFIVVERKEDFHGIYLVYNGELLTHKKTWKQATKIASLLEFAYKYGYNDCLDENFDYEEDNYYDD